MSLVSPRLVSPSAKPPSVCLLDWSLCQVFFISLDCCIGESLEDNEKTVMKGEEEEEEEEEGGLCTKRG